jgi:hypothetical protein
MSVESRNARLLDQIREDRESSAPGSSLASTRSRTLRRRLALALPTPQRKLVLPVYRSAQLVIRSVDG